MSEPVTCPHCGESIATDDVYEVDPHTEGGTYMPMGATQAELNITYNYGKWYRAYLDESNGIRVLDGQIAGNTIDVLEKAVAELGTIRDHDDYWNATPGNAGHALSVLLEWAKKYPDGVWRVS